jgi:predicted DNA-binding transcriptional regulator AlpA
MNDPRRRGRPRSVKPKAELAPEPTRWLTRGQLAKYLTIAASSVDKRVDAGQLPLPSYLLGQNAPRWDRAAIDSRMEHSQQEAQSSQWVEALHEYFEQKRLRKKGIIPSPTGALAETELGRRQLAFEAKRREERAKKRGGAG